METSYVIKVNRMLSLILRSAVIVLLLAWLTIPLLTDGYSEFLESTLYEKVLIVAGIIIMIIATIWMQFDRLRGGLLGVVIVFAFGAFHIVDIVIFSHNIITDFYLIASLTLIFCHYFEQIVIRKEIELSVLKKKFQHLERSYEITQAMMGVTPKMLLDDDIDKLLQDILEIAIDLVPKAESGSILIHKDDEFMEFRAAVGYDLDMLREVNLRYQDTYQYRIGTLLEPTVIRDIKTFNEANPERDVAREFAEKETEMAASVLTCAIQFDDKIYGFINLDNMNNKDAFDEQDKLLIKHLASQIEIALNNHHLVEEIHKLSQFDSLTGAYSREHYDKTIQSLVKHNHTALCLAILDVNDLKKVNDTYGHSAGDQYIVHFVQIIKRNLLSKDSVYRTGGDEFVILMPDLKLQEGIKRLEKIHDDVKVTPFVIDGQNVPIEFGSGVAHYKDDHEDLQMVIRLADKRMYQDKKERKYLP
ncbi:MAG: sensor domain-containing diguanylate cyclase [Acholeplasma sp.]|nr:MAG: sensor domain-containing diguanylate cyclase [Acholeplasma sp.]